MIRGKSRYTKRPQRRRNEPGSYTRVADPFWPAYESHRRKKRIGQSTKGVSRKRIRQGERGAARGARRGRGTRRSAHRGGRRRRDSAGQPEQTGVVSASPLTNCDTTSCHTRLNSPVARLHSTGNKLMFARHIWVARSRPESPEDPVARAARRITDSPARAEGLSMTRRRDGSKYAARGRVRRTFDTSARECWHSVDGR